MIQEVYLFLSDKRRDTEEPVSGKDGGRSKKKKKKGGFLYTVGILVCLAVMAYSGYRLVTTSIAYHKGTEEYDGLRQYTSPVSDEQEIVVTDSSVQTSSEGEGDKNHEPPIDVDFQSLKAINEDVVGWIYIGALDISYPIVHGTDDDFYLHHTFRKNYNFAGSIFLEAQNKDTFTDPNTIIYGHNMKNGSMFGKLKNLPDKYQDDPYFWILTPDGDYCYQIFSMHVVNTGGEAYTLFSDADKTFTDWAEKMESQSSVDLGDTVFTNQSKVVTLSTCNGNEKTRFVVQGVRIQ